MVCGASGCLPILSHWSLRSIFPYPAQLLGPQCYRVLSCHLGTVFQASLLGRNGKIVLIPEFMGLRTIYCPHLIQEWDITLPSIISLFLIFQSSPSSSDRKLPLLSPLPTSHFQMQIKQADICLEGLQNPRNCSRFKVKEKHNLHVHVLLLKTRLQ